MSIPSLAPLPFATMHRSRNSPLSGFLVLCLAATWFIWGSTYLAIKFALTSFPPFLQMGTRFLVAGTLPMAWVRWKRSPWPSRREWCNAFIIGALMIAGGMGAAAYAEQTVGSGILVAFVAVIPLLIAVLNRLWGIIPGRRELIGILIGFAGVLLLTRGANISASPVGLVAMCIGTSCWAMGSVLSQRKFVLAPGAAGFASEMLCGGVVLMGLAALRGETLSWPPAPLAAASWLYLVVFGSLLAFNAYMVLLANVSAGLASSYSYVNPVIALLLGVWLGGETVTPFEWMASGVILAGVVLLLYSRKTVPSVT